MSSGILLHWPGHGEGHTEICYDANGNTVFTSGCDGKVNIWAEFKDDIKPKSIRAGDIVHAIATKGEVVYTAADNNSVDKYNVSDGSPDGILLRFTSNVTHLALSESKNAIVAGSSDFTAKLVDLETNDQKIFTGHKAPILGIAADPLDEYLATASCDGDLRIWSVTDANVLETIKITKPSNDICNSESLCRMSWRPATGEDIAVPSGNEIKVFSRGTWMVLHSFTTALTKKPFNCCCFSPCGRFLAAATIDGWICVWDAETHDCLQTVQHTLGTSICCLTWDPRENNILAFADVRGQVGLLKDAIPSITNTQQNSVPDDLDALFEEEDGDLNDFLDDAATESDSRQEDDTKMKKHDLSDDNDIDVNREKKPSQASDFDIPSTNNIILAADDDLAPPVIPATASAKPKEEDAASSVSEFLGDDETEPREPKQVYKGPVPTAMQPAFQPSATPMHLSHRFMVWNSVGTIRSYADDTECAIDVEFHDKQHHYALHLNNEAPGGGSYNIMADLSMNAVALAAESTEDAPSKLTCIYYASWEGSKEWSVEMPEEEEIRALTIGETWIAVCTDSRMVRMFSLAGMQRFIFSIPGPVVSMSAHTDQLFIAYHTTQGFNGNQCLSYMLLEVVVGTGSSRPKKIVGGDPLPISKKSSLLWLGFSAEGTPVTVDTAGVVRIMNRGFCNTWIPVSYLNKLHSEKGCTGLGPLLVRLIMEYIWCKDFYSRMPFLTPPPFSRFLRHAGDTTKSRHDHYWVVGLHENPQELRAIMCKGSAYPSTLPRPFPTVLQYKLPLCEPDSEKSKFEEEYWRLRLFSSHTDYLESHGFEVDDKQKQLTKVQIQQALMKAFALACKMDRESRAYEICDMLPSSTSVNLAIKYASKMKRMVLAQKLGEVAKEKTQDEMQALMKMQRRQVYSEEEEESDDQDDFKQDLQAGYSRSNTEWAEHKKMTLSKKKKKEDSDVEEVDQDEDIQSYRKDDGLDDIPDLVQKHSSPSQPTTKLTEKSRNPFKKKVTALAMSSSQASNSGEAVISSTSTSSVLDNIPRKSSAQKLRGVIAKSHTALKKPTPKATKKQQTLFGAKSKFQLTSTPKGKKPQQTQQKQQEVDQSGISKQILRDVRNEITTGVQLYVSEMREKLTDQNPGLDGLEIRKIAIQHFRKLTQDERQSWNDRAKNSGDALTTVGAKRKLDDEATAHEEESENVPQADVETHHQPSSKLRKTDQSEGKADDKSSRLAAFAYESKE